MSKVNASTYPEFRGQVVDIFEDYCADNNIFIQNDERDGEVEDYLTECASLTTDDNDGSIPSLDLAIIYGDDYDTIVGALEHYMDIDNDPSDATIEDKEAAIKDIIDAFYDIVRERALYIDANETVSLRVVSVNEDVVKFFHDKLDELFTKWELE